MTVTINGKEYCTKNIGFKAMRELGRLGMTPKMLEQFEDQPYEILPYLAAYIMGTTPEKAADELEAHFDNGGTLEELSPIIEMLAEGSFFNQTTKKN